MSAIHIKICGITNISDALAAVEAGASYLGFIFVAKSPRSVLPQTAGTIIQAVKKQHPHVQCVGVFQNHSQADIQNVLHVASLDLIQLHGDESLAFCEQLTLPVMKVMTIVPEESNAIATDFVEALMNPANNVKALLLDLPKEQTSASVMRAQALPVSIQLLLKTQRCFLAGGFMATNIQEALSGIHPYGVDVASGVEESPGQKSIEKMRAFCQAVHMISTELQETL